ncbi:hypothetical protein J31TS4_41960 [Paenibacillus sp. J31TS4]|uniref:hypothetical protein n=1 Tax=Paenibacillus sp. J31TS4 TaxID=2807195 RepID=UPI001B21D55E|nr:hypothetical protein [Paenibacillus sp. J31TS4]GIP40916.1 hypothetical protein J31TS4_41960 [Paenibacillus sp. J31TS4]
MLPFIRPFEKGLLTALLLPALIGCSSLSSGEQAALGSPERPVVDMPVPPLLVSAGRSPSAEPAALDGRGWTETQLEDASALLTLNHRESGARLTVERHEKEELAPDTQPADLVTLAWQGMAIHDGEEALTETPAPVLRSRTVTGSRPALQAKVPIGSNIGYIAVLPGPDASYIVTMQVPANWSPDDETAWNEMLAAAAIARSKPLPASLASAAVSREPSAVLASGDGLLRIELPSSWKQEETLNEQAALQAADRTQEEFMIVLSENKALFPTGTSLQKYWALLQQGKLSEVVRHADLSEPEETSIGGREALQIEVKGEVDKVRIAYAYTLVATDTQFHQIIFWTTQPRMEERREAYRKAAASFRAPGMEGDPAAAND